MCSFAVYRVGYMVAVEIARHRGLNASCVVLAQCFAIAYAV